MNELVSSFDFEMNKLISSEEKHHQRLPDINNNKSRTWWNVMAS